MGGGGGGERERERERGNLLPVPVMIARNYNYMQRKWYCSPQRSQGAARLEETAGSDRWSQSVPGSVRPVSNHTNPVTLNPLLGGFDVLKAGVWGVGVSVCVGERERERVCVCVRQRECVCVSEREILCV